MAKKKNKGQYVVQPGDSPAKIAKMIYGDERMWYELVKANGGMTNLKAGSVLNLPQKVKKPWIPNAVASAVGMATSGEYQAWAAANGTGGVNAEKMPGGFPTQTTTTGTPGNRPVAQSGRYNSQSGMTVNGGAETRPRTGVSTAPEGGLGAGMGANPPLNSAGQFNGVGMQPYTAPAAPQNQPITAPVGGPIRTGTGQSAPGAGDILNSAANFVAGQYAKARGLPTGTPPGGQSPIYTTPGAGTPSAASDAAKAAQKQQESANAAAQAQAQAKAKQEAAQLPPGSTTYTGTNLPKTPAAVRTALDSGKFPYVVSGNNAMNAYPNMPVAVLHQNMLAAGYTYNSFGGYYVFSGSQNNATTSTTITPGSIAAQTPAYLPIIGKVPQTMNQVARRRSNNNSVNRISISGVIDGNMDWRVASG